MAANVSGRNRLFWDQVSRHAPGSRNAHAWPTSSLWRVCPGSSEKPFRSTSPNSRCRSGTVNLIW